MGASQNETDKDVDRKTNFFLLMKYFQSSRTNLLLGMQTLGEAVTYCVSCNLPSCPLCCEKEGRLDM